MHSALTPKSKQEDRRTKKQTGGLFLMHGKLCKNIRVSESLMLGRLRRR